MLRTPWPDKLLYAFPLIPLIPLLLDRIKKDRQRVTLVDPRRTNVNWFPVLRPPSAADLAGGGSPAGRMSDQKPSNAGPTPLGLAAEQEHLLKFGLSDNVVRTIKMCVLNLMFPVLHSVLSADSKGQRLAFSTVKTCPAALSSCHQGFGDRTAFSHSLMKPFLMSIFH